MLFELRVFTFGAKQVYACQLLGPQRELARDAGLLMAVSILTGGLSC
jgi:hypothetical protein